MIAEEYLRVADSQYVVKFRGGYVNREPDPADEDDLVADIDFRVGTPAPTATAGGTSRI